MALTITAANATYLISVASVFPTPVQLQGFGVDEAFDTEAVESAEVQLGVDGLSGAGWVPRLTRQTITLMANSPSVAIFESWLAAMDQIREVLQASGTIIIPSIGRKYALSQGTLTRPNQIGNVRRVLAARAFEITWGWPITSAPV